MNSIKGFLDNEGKIKKFPSKEAAKLAILKYLAQNFSCNRDYTEKEVNSIIDAWHTFGDYFLLRRELVDYKFLLRTADGLKYWKAEEPEGHLL